ncbi:MAG: hypothetical protein WC205_16855 [Opitutaceae bacterium]|jgi:hypothetical protein
MSGHDRPSIGTAGGSDRAARFAHLQDLIERDSRGSAHGLPTVYHEVAAVGVMHAPGENDVTLITLVTDGGQSHVFALDKKKADHFREELVAMSRTVKGIADLAYRARNQERRNGRDPIGKPNGRLL